MEPFVKIFKKMTTWGWYKDANTFRVFMHILIKANYKPSEYMGVTIGRGQCVFGRKAWAEELGLSEQQVRTAINHLKSTNEITTYSTNKFTVITVVKWDFWQVENGKVTNEPTNDATSNQPTTNQQLTTSKEIKKYRNKDIVINKAEGISMKEANSLTGWTLEEKLKAWEKAQ